MHIFIGGPFEPANLINEQRIENANVLIEGNLPKTIAREPIESPDAIVLDGAGRTLMPGLHDMHTHVGIFRPVAGDNRTDMTPFLVGAVAAARADSMISSRVACGYP